MQLRSNSLRPIEILEDETRFRRLIIVALQIGGALFARLAYRIYGSRLPNHQFISAVIEIAELLGIGVLLAFSGLLGNPTRVVFRKLNPNALEIDDVVTFLSAFLLVCDALMCSVVVIATGGLGRSFFAPLLIAIGGSAITLRLPLRSCLIGLLAAVSGIILAWWVPVYARPAMQWAGLHPTDPSGVGHYELAQWISRVGAVSLTLISALQWLRDPIPTTVVNRVLHDLEEMVEDFAEQRASLRAGMIAFKNDAGRRNSLVTLSEVHDLSTIIEQASILTIPYGGKSFQPARKHVVYLTFLTHWIDDLFDQFFAEIDELGCSCTIDGLRQNSRNFRMLYFRMRSRLDFNQYPARKKVIERGIRKIFLAALMQRCRVRGALKPIMSEYVELVTDYPGVHSRIVELYRMLLNGTSEGDTSKWFVLWGTAKVLPEVFDCCAGEIDMSCEELYAILTAPVLILQNLAAEVQKEPMTDHFRSLVCDPTIMLKADPPGGKSPLIECISIFRAHDQLLRGEGPVLCRARRDQLKALLKVYGHHLPSTLKQAYTDLIDDDSFWKSLEVESVPAESSSSSRGGSDSTGADETLPQAS